MTSAWKVVAVGLVVVLGACGGRMTVVSRKSAGYTKELDRLVVFADTGRMPEAIGESFKARLIPALESRGVKARLGRFGGMAAQEKPSILAQAKEFEATTVLVLVPSARAFEGDRGVIQQFDGEIFDVRAERVVWRAQFEWGTAAVVRDTSASVDPAIGEILTAFAADGLIGPASRPPDRAAAASQEQAK